LVACCALLAFSLSAVIGVHLASLMLRMTVLFVALQRLIWINRADCVAKILTFPECGLHPHEAGRVTSQPAILGGD
jgi:hypothetical protein